MLPGVRQRREQNKADSFKKRRLALGGRSNVRRPAQTIVLGVRLQHPGHFVRLHCASKGVSGFAFLVSALSCVNSKCECGDVANVPISWQHWWGARVFFFAQIARPRACTCAYNAAVAVQA